MVNEEPVLLRLELVLLRPEIRPYSDDLRADFGVELPSVSVPLMDRSIASVASLRLMSTICSFRVTG